MSEMGQMRKYPRLQIKAALHPRSGHREARTAGPKSADIVAKVENRTTPKISRKPIFRDSCCRNTLWANTKIGGRFGRKRCGPSRLRTRSASAVFKIFVLRPKKTFATISAQSGHCPRHRLSGAESTTSVG